METPESHQESSARPITTIRPPGWFRTLYVASFVAWVVFALVLLLAGHSELTSAVSLMFWILAAATLPVAVASSIRRLEYWGTKVVLVRLTGRMECATDEIASIRLTAGSYGMSRAAFLRRDGSPVFQRARLSIAND